MDRGSWARGWPFCHHRSARLMRRIHNPSRRCFQPSPAFPRLTVYLRALCPWPSKLLAHARAPEVALLNRLVFENLRRRPVRTCLSVLAIGVEVTMILTLVGISYGTLDETARRARGVGADIIV